MSYYKVKVKHKRIDNIETWFYLMGDPIEEVDRLLKTCSKPNISYYPIRETLVEIPEQEYLRFYNNYVFQK